MLESIGRWFKSLKEHFDSTKLYDQKQNLSFYKNRSLIIRKQTKTTSMWWWREKILMDEEVGRCFQKAIHGKRWYAKASITILNNWKNWLSYIPSDTQSHLLVFSSIKWHWITLTLCAAKMNTANLSQTNKMAVVFLSEGPFPRSAISVWLKLQLGDSHRQCATMEQGYLVNRQHPSIAQLVERRTVVGQCWNP